MRSDSQAMGCFVSTPKDACGNRRWPSNIDELAVFVPGLRVPKSVDFSSALSDILPKPLVERLSSLRMRIVAMVAQEASKATKQRRKTTTKHGGSSFSELLQLLEDYLSVLLGLVGEGSQLKDKVQFMWVNQEDDAEETVMVNAWYEALSVLQLMAMLCLSEANTLLLPKAIKDGYQTKVSEESKRTSIDIFLKAAGYLDCAIQHVLPQIPPTVRRDLPVDLAEGVLRALLMQALGQCADIQLGMAIDSPKATLAVKRRLACEMVKYWDEAAAYYYHGLILDEGNTKKSHSMAVGALQAADEFLKESKKASESFNATLPTSRNPPLSGSMKYLSEKIPKDALSKLRINRDLYSQERILETAPTLPDFALALKPDEYHLPQLDPLWSLEAVNSSKT
ncbi:BRO1 domain-containing protein [Dioscorea alata]|uniref:BRO1 domain-containing protein n=2 Tax=Dioscorea alata TaxID=55571 RepID=A0ACB7WP16_DIOAL|nr:BRO1 domain-containing protein [Dioscorea alata]